MNTKKKRVAITTLGCKVNQYESASFLSGFTEQGMEIVGPGEPADIFVINTCAVTARAAALSRQTIRRAHRANPDAKIMITGCYAQTDPDGARKAASGCSPCIVDNHRKHLLVEASLCESKEGAPSIHDPHIHREKKISPLRIKSLSGRTRPFLKIQDGCNNFCTYCIVPHARGRSRSLEPEAVLEQARIFAGAGYREMVVTGIHVGAYGHDLPEKISLRDILRQLAMENPEIRLRISSLEPSEISQELLHLMAKSPNIMPHLHIPLQSGDNSILRAMHRHYTAEDFRNIVLSIRKNLPEAALGADVLVGFPGEDDLAFAATHDLLAGLPITYLHVFPYSKRPGTPAAELEGQIARQVKEQRVARLRALDREKRIAFYQSQLGSTRPVLLEGRRRGSKKILQGFSDNYVPVKVEAPATLAGKIVPVLLHTLQDDLSVAGSVV